ncbi:glycoside hydrolase family 38 N-terminal domain-containing protein [Auraticoccus monumenti]|uniref:Glycosyl hydrolases family 38 C-terminal domain-containing protein n=1 Tax=Auraticoccus monumenti TaxID=675864 RepID=A0A1G6YXQ6_9ACTN|nr:glycoside hydrolase family 38 C-terminal domain-containing protein [Auraticoccus monumenti]SDD95101.1 Glycosyl hydrolases family 38 C-terminal domain-containing protein [Auraticoccus monumenti]
MPDKALVAAVPWSGDDARAGLLRYAACAELVLDDVLLRVVCEPLLTRDDSGRRLRSIRLDLEGLGTVTADEVRLTAADGTEVPLRPVEAPTGSLRLLVPAAEEEQRLRLSLPGRGAAAVVELVTDVVREWTIHLVHHSHLDIGYTDPQPRIQAEQRSYLDSALDLCRATDDWPEESRFRWAVESLWTFEQWAALRPRSDVEELLERVRDGQVELTAMPYNLHTDTCSTDELHELLRTAREVRDRHGVDFSSAMQTDVPGTVAGFPDALAEVGVRYLSVANNWAGRSMPHTNGGDDLPQLFWWTTPAGNRVLVWMTDSPHGLAYLEGPFLGFSEDYESVDRLLPAYLTSNARNPYPFPPGVFGWHGDPVSTREPYPWDVLHLRTQGWIGDNGPARLAAAEIVRRWNETWEWPRLRTSTNEEFFTDAEHRLGDRLPTFEGDWGDWWVEGVGSAALPQALVRGAQARVTDAQVLSQAARLLGGEANDTEVDQARDTYRSISLFNEHTWGASNSWLSGDEGADSGELQWHWKAAHALAAQERSEAFLEKSAAVLGAQLPTGPGAVVSVHAVNTQAVPRTSTVRFLLRESLVPTAAPVEVRDGRSGAPLPFVEEAQHNRTHREAGRWLRVHVPDVPALGVVSLDVHILGLAAATSSSSPATDEGLPGRDATHDAGSPHPPELPRSELLTLRNEHLQVRFDERRSCIASIVELATGRELVEPDAVVGFNAYVYDTYGTAGGYNHLSNKTSTGPQLELLGSRSLARPCAVLERVDDGVEQRLVVEFAADGVDRGQVTLRLRRGEPVLHIENRLWKPTTMTKESAFFAFPFAGEEPTLRYEISGGVTGDGLAHVPGAPQHMRAVRDWVTVSDTDSSVAWVTRDAPLVHPHVIALPYAPFPDSTSPREPGTVYSWVHNNVWDTNFPVQQGFDATFSYAVGVDGGRGLSREGLAVATAAEAVHPLVGVVARGPASPEAPAGRQLLTLDDDRVKVVSVCAGERGGVQVRLQSFADEAVQVRLGVPFASAEALLTTYLGDLVSALETDGRDVLVPLPRLGSLAVELTGVGDRV